MFPLGIGTGFRRFTVSEIGDARSQAVVDRGDRATSLKAGQD
jgi:hypothetical protein